MSAAQRKIGGKKVTGESIAIPTGVPAAIVSTGVRGSANAKRIMAALTLDQLIAFVAE